MPALRYLVRIRIVEFQDWHTPPPSSDDKGYYPRDDDSDSRDSNYHGYHPGTTSSGGGRPRTTRFGGASDPRLGLGWGPAFCAREARSNIWVGAVACPVASMRGAVPCRGYGSRIPTGKQARVKAPVDMQVDLSVMQMCSPSPVTSPACDPTLAEAALCMPRMPVIAPEERVHTFDVLPRRGPSPICGRFGFVGSDLDLEFERWAGLGKALPLGSPDGPDVLCGLGPSRFDDDQVDRSLAQEVDLCLSGPEDCSFGPSSPDQPAGSVTLPTHTLAVPGGEDDEVAAAVNEVCATRPTRDVAMPIDEFIHSFKKPLQQPILLSPPRLRKTRATRQKELADEDLVPKRSARLAPKCKHREPKPEA